MIDLENILHFLMKLLNNKKLAKKSFAKNLYKKKTKFIDYKIVIIVANIIKPLN